jgi:ABC-2 type transport system permease protein
MKAGPVADSVFQTFDVGPDRRSSTSSRLIALWAAYVLTLRQHLHGKRWMVIAGMCVLCVGLVVLVRVTAPDAAPVMLEFNFAFMFIPQAMLPLLALIYASGIVQDEQEEQTMTYLLIRPIPKWALYSVKLFATLTTTVILAVALTALTYAAVYVGAETGMKDAPYRALQAAAIHSLAVIAYCCLFGLISLLTKRILIVGILYAAFLEGLFANMPFSIRLATVIYYTRLIAYRSMSFVTATPGRSTGTTDIAADIWQLDVHADPGLLDHPQIRTCLIVLLAASAACAVLAAILFSQREFHVKTPEKA